jgi:hypothetical protein
MIELRCEKHLHLKVDPETGTIEVKCSQCSQAQRRPVFHRWALVRVDDARESLATGPPAEMRRSRADKQCA